MTTQVGFSLPLLITNSLDGAMLKPDDAISDVGSSRLLMLAGSGPDERSVGHVTRIVRAPSALLLTAAMRDDTTQARDMVASIEEGYPSYALPMISPAVGPARRRRLLAVRVVSVETWAAAELRLSRPAPSRPVVVIPPAPTRRW